MFYTTHTLYWGLDNTDLFVGDLSRESNIRDVIFAGYFKYKLVSMRCSIENV